MPSQGYSYDDLDHDKKLSAFLAQGVAGPLCEYWSEEQAPMCGHASCYTIVCCIEKMPDKNLGTTC